MKSDPDRKNEQDLFKVLVYATCLGFGGLAAFLCSFRDLKTDLALEFSYRTVAGFAAGAALGWLFWKVIRRLSERDRREP